MDIICDGNILICDNFLSNEESFILTQWFNNFDYVNLNSHEYDFWHKRLIRRDQTPLQNGYENSFDEVTVLIDKIRNRLIKTLNLFDNNEWDLSEFNFIKMWNGSNPFPERRNKSLEMFYHTDNQENNGYEKEIFWGAVIYPNDDYEGGELSYPKYKLIHKPKAGSIVFHRGNVKHGVKIVNTGNRYSIASTVFKK
jgi:2OG-Fe(II) oxygenase superfamily